VAEDLPAAFFCGQVYAPCGRLLPFRGLSSRRAFRNAFEVSSRERRLRVATFASAPSVPGQRYCLEQIPARGVPFSKSSDPNIQRKMLRLDSNALVNDDIQAFVTRRFRCPFDDRFIWPIFRHKSSATAPFDPKPGSKSLIFVEFLLLGFDRRDGCTWTELQCRPIAWRPLCADIMRYASDYRNGSSRNPLHASTRCKFSHAEPNCIDSTADQYTRLLLHKSISSSQIGFSAKSIFCLSVTPALTC
jgi:hypothetical protein